VSYGFYDQHGNWISQATGPRTRIPCQCDGAVTGDPCRPWCPGEQVNLRHPPREERRAA
jgi:hypothetical protein